MDLSGVNSLSDPGFIFCGGKSIHQPDKFCIRNSMLFHEANVFPVEISDRYALCFLFIFGRLCWGWKAEFCVLNHFSAEDKVFGWDFSDGCGEMGGLWGSSLLMSAGVAPREANAAPPCAPGRVWFLVFSRHLERHQQNAGCGAGPAAAWASRLSYFPPPWQVFFPYIFKCLVKGGICRREDASDHFYRRGGYRGGCAACMFGCDVLGWGVVFQVELQSCPIC